MLSNKAQLRRRTFVIATCSLMPPWPLAQAQPFPNRPIRIVVPAPPGSPPDLMARLFANEMKDDLGQPVVVDNKPGAGGGLGATEVARSPGDGYTLLLAVDTIVTINPLIYSQLGYDPGRDLKPVSMVGNTGGVLVVNPGLGVKSLPELVRLAQSKPNGLNYASGGSGHATHLGTELLLQAANIKMTHVPYRGTPLGVQDVIAGQAQVRPAGGAGYHRAGGQDDLSERP
jgi:tripartite-type tricarboxylate transporter receptor subunit TctC